MSTHTDPEITAFVLHIGATNPSGGFDHPIWPRLSSWANHHMDGLLLYFYESPEFLAPLVQSLGLNPATETLPEPDARLSHVRVDLKDDQPELLLRRLSFDPDAGVTHLLGLNASRLLFSITVEDDENFAVFYLTGEEAVDLGKALDGHLEGNAEVCTAHRQEILAMLDGHSSWLPLQDPSIAQG
ncbi:hypothetical protein [Nannocystis punicea]|uniref:Uncharacterized protein n=1 Tax=Nannocystis punicea TaxID=2995304 RepID=A0ABY7H7A9_9BACT|nr:hypothetical protein [Nannocystis poenicansa]WAS94970.1 hypothetical protein O0S08_02310 [Nannocystis poenicansa]